MNKVGKDFAALLAGEPPRDSSTVRGFVKDGGVGGLTVIVGGGEIVVTKAACRCALEDVQAGRMTPGKTVELSRVDGVYAVRGLVQGF